MEKRKEIRIIKSYTVAEQTVADICFKELVELIENKNNLTATDYKLKLLSIISQKYMIQVAPIIISNNISIYDTTHILILQEIIRHKLCNPTVISYNCKQNKLDVISIKKMNLYTFLNKDIYLQAPEACIIIAMNIIQNYPYTNARYEEILEMLNNIWDECHNHKISLDSDMLSSIIKHSNRPDVDDVIKHKLNCMLLENALGVDDLRNVSFALNNLNDIKSYVLSPEQYVQILIEIGDRLHRYENKEEIIDRDYFKIIINSATINAINNNIMVEYKDLVAAELIRFGEVDINRKYIKNSVIKLLANHFTEPCNAFINLIELMGQTPNNKISKLIKDKELMMRPEYASVICKIICNDPLLLSMYRLKIMSNVIEAGVFNSKDNVKELTHIINSFVKFSVGYGYIIRFVDLYPKFINKIEKINYNNLDTLRYIGNYFKTTKIKDAPRNMDRIIKSILKGVNMKCHGIVRLNYIVILSNELDAETCKEIIELDNMELIMICRKCKVKGTKEFNNYIYSDRCFKKVNTNPPKSSMNNLIDFTNAGMDKKVEEAKQIREEHDSTYPSPEI